MYTYSRWMKANAFTSILDLKFIINYPIFFIHLPLRLRFCGSVSSIIWWTPYQFNVLDSNPDDSLCLTSQVFQVQAKDEIPQNKFVVVFDNEQWCTMFKPHIKSFYGTIHFDIFSHHHKINHEMNMNFVVHTLFMKYPQQSNNCN